MQRSTKIRLTPPPLLPISSNAVSSKKKKFTGRRALPSLPKITGCKWNQDTTFKKGRLKPQTGFQTTFCVEFSATAPADVIGILQKYYSVFFDGQKVEAASRNPEGYAVRIVFGDVPV